MQIYSYVIMLLKKLPMLFLIINKEKIGSKKSFAFESTVLDAFRFNTTRNRMVLLSANT